MRTHSFISYKCINAIKGNAAQIINIVILRVYTWHLQLKKWTQGTQLTNAKTTIMISNARDEHTFFTFNSFKTYAFKKNNWNPLECKYLKKQTITK